MNGLCSRSIVKAVAVVFPTFAALMILPGCTIDGYPDDLKYPMRTDQMAVGTPKKDAPYFDLPGQYPKVLFAYLTDEEREQEKLLVDPNTLAADLRDRLDKDLTDIFGMPAAPTVQSTNSDLHDVLAKLSDQLKLEPTTLNKGAQLYRQQCLHCHGLTGDGQGATSPWVNPHPRDYRLGRFKFTSSSQPEGERKPRREDLERTIREGIDGTSMPTFRMLADEDIDALASYVIHLSMRGETEYLVTAAALRGGELDEGPDGITSGVNQYVALIANRWTAAQASLIQPHTFPAETISDADMQKSVQNGWKMFTQPGEAGCIGCHTDFGRQSAYKYDVWGTIVRPADLTAGIYRGGCRPIDLFWRIHSGINGTGMTAFGKRTPEDPNGLSANAIWDLVHLLQVLPYPAMRQKYGIKLEG
jgi:mono/diheme cytochrome c family protein